MSLPAHWVLATGNRGKLTELNITSPTGIRHIEELEKRNVAAAVLEGIERLAAAMPG